MLRRRRGRGRVGHEWVDGCGVFLYVYIGLSEGVWDGHCMIPEAVGT